MCDVIKFILKNENDIYISLNTIKKMLKDIFNIVFSYLDIDEYYKIKDDFKLSVVYYCKNVKEITKESKSWYKHIRFYKKNKMDWASYNNYLDVIKYLHSTKKECTMYTMSWASQNGHLEVVKYLHSIGNNCTLRAIHWADAKGHQEVVKYLKSIKK